MSVHNGEMYLADAVQSVLGQTFSDFEFIIVDDGSTDSTSKILDSYTDPRVVLIKNEHNLGLTASLNNGISFVRGKYIARMDADDISLPNRLSLQVEYLEKNESVGVLGSQMDVVDMNGRFSTKYQAPISHDQIAWALIHKRAFAHPTVMIRRSALQRAGGYDQAFRVAQDFELWTRMVWTTRFANLPQTLVHYRAHSASTSVVNSAMQKLNVEKARHGLACRVLKKDVPLGLIQLMSRSQGKGQDLSKDESAHVVSLILDLYNGYQSSGLFVGDTDESAHADMIQNVMLASRSSVASNEPAGKPSVNLQPRLLDLIPSPARRIGKKLIGVLKSSKSTQAVSAPRQTPSSSLPPAGREGITIIVLSYERMKSLKLMLESLYKQDMSRLPFELILCNNSPRFHLKKSYFSGVGRVLKKFHDVKVLNIDYSWRTGIRYALAALSKYDTIFFVDDDVILRRPDFVQYMYANYKKLESSDILSCWGRLWAHCTEEHHDVISLTFNNFVVKDITKCDVVGPGICMFNKKILTPAVLEGVINPDIPGAYDMGFSLVVFMEHGGQSYFLPSYEMINFHEEKVKAPLMATPEQRGEMNAFFKRLYKKGYQPVYDRLSPSEIEDSPERRVLDTVKPKNVPW